MSLGMDIYIELHSLSTVEGVMYSFVYLFKSYDVCQVFKSLLTR